MKEFIVFVAVLMTAMTACGADTSGVQIASTAQPAGSSINQALPPQVNETYEYYDIYGDNENDLRSQMSRNGIKWNDGKTYDALTTWNVKWDYDYDCSVGGCKARSFQTTVDIIFRYPRWDRPANPAQALATKWDTYMNNLVTHENGHRDMAVNETAEMAAAVMQLTAPSRAELDRQITALADQRMASMNADEVAYDTTTVHGSTQGAVFP